LTHGILGITLPLISLPFCSGSDSDRFVEVTPMLQLLRTNGNNPSEEIIKRHIARMQENNLYGSKVRSGVGVLRCNPFVSLTIDGKHLDYSHGCMEAFLYSFKKTSALESGGIAKSDENRMVGQYWLRNPPIAASNDLKTAIREAWKI
jgi:hypothetical protein